MNLTEGLLIILISEKKPKINIKNKQINISEEKEIILNKKIKINIIPPKGKISLL
tara:strand:- start:565 stop:729 length:165 start_codon:yes stop_codon:yes gene_type:complete